MPMLLLFPPRHRTWLSLSRLLNLFDNRQHWTLLLLNLSFGGLISLVVAAWQLVLNKFHV
jgi:hypothetical protein